MDSKERILLSAVEVFAEKGKHGARMEEIAAKARINKAMLYYFYTTKDNLYREILTRVMADISGHIAGSIDASLDKARDYAGKMKIIVKSHFDAYTNNINHTKILLEAMATGPDDLARAIVNVKACSKTSGKRGLAPERFFDFFEKGIVNGSFRKADPRQVLTSIIGMNLIYFMSQPIARALLELSADDETKFVKERQESIIDLLLYGIMEKRSAS